MLIKIRAPPGPTRMEVLQLVEIFRARVADVSERSITLCVTGDAGKVRHPSQASWVVLLSGDIRKRSVLLYFTDTKAYIATLKPV